MTATINRFKGDYKYLSNFYIAPFNMFGFIYPTVEHAFQSWKTTDPEQRHAIHTARTPSDAKSLGNNPQTCSLRPDWNRRKVHIMNLCVTSKFLQNYELAKMLVATGNALIEEGNNWGDTYWGVVNGQGENMLGKILMAIREELQTSFT